MPSPSPTPTQEQLVALVESWFSAPGSFIATSTSTASTTPAPLTAAQQQELDMKTATRDQLVRQLEELIGSATRIRDTLRDTAPARITTQYMEEWTEGLVVVIDKVFITAHPALAQPARAVAADTSDDEDEDDTEDSRF